MTTKRILGVDVDGVLADFNRSFIDLVIDVTGRDLFPPRPFEIPTWDYPQHYGYTDDECKQVWGVIERSGLFWQRLSPYYDIFDSCRYLREMEGAGADLYFVTSRPGLTAKTQTEEWLWQQGFSQPTVLISSKKGYCATALKFDAYIDDRWENAVDVARESGSTKSVLLDRPWNRTYDVEKFGITRTTTVVGFADLAKVA